MCDRYAKLANGRVASTINAENRVSDIDEEGQTGGVRSRTRQSNKGRPTVLAAIDQAFLFSFILRAGTDMAVASVLFGISQAATPRYFMTWLDMY